MVLVYVLCEGRTVGKLDVNHVPHIGDSIIMPSAQYLVLDVRWEYEGERYLMHNRDRIHKLSAVTIITKKF